MKGKGAYDGSHATKYERGGGNYNAFKFTQMKERKVLTLSIGRGRRR